MHFHKVLPISREKAEIIFKGDNTKKICDALVSVAFYEADWTWVQNICLEFLECGNPILSSLAATCLGHVARVHGMLEKEKVLSALKRYEVDSEIGGFVKDAIADINHFIK